MQLLSIIYDNVLGTLMSIIVMMKKSGTCLEFSCKTAVNWTLLCKLILTCKTQDFWMSIRTIPEKNGKI